MLHAPSATVVEIKRDAERIELRCSVAGDPAAYYFGVEGRGDEATAWLSTLSVGDAIPLAGLPYARYNKERRRYEMFLTVTAGAQAALGG